MVVVVVVAAAAVVVVGGGGGAAAVVVGMRQDFEFRKGLNSNLFPSRAGRRHRTQMA